MNKGARPCAAGVKHHAWRLENPEVPPGERVWVCGRCGKHAPAQPSDPDYADYGPGRERAAGQATKAGR